MNEGKAFQSSDSESTENRDTAVALDNEKKETHPDQPTEPTSEEETADTAIPRALTTRFMKTSLIGVLIIVVSLTFAFLERSIVGLLPCALLGVVFILWGLNFLRLFHSGQIEERAMRCINVTTYKIASRMRVSFEDAEGNFHEFMLDKRSEPFIVDAVYILYSKKSDPKTLICWQLL